MSTSKALEAVRFQKNQYKDICQTFEHTEWLFYLLVPDDAPKPHFYVYPGEGMVIVEWYFTLRYFLTISIYCDGNIKYHSRIGEVKDSGQGRLDILSKEFLEKFFEGAS